MRARGAGSTTPATYPPHERIARGRGRRTCASGVGDPVADRVPRLPGDAEDHCSDGEGDQRVSHVESERDHHGTENDSETYVGVGSGMISVRHESRAVESPACSCTDERSDEVAEEADRTCQGECNEVLGCLGVDDPHDGLVCSNAGTDEDRQHDGETRVPLGSLRAQCERHAQRDSGQRVAYVVDQIGEKRDAAGEDEDHRLRGRRQPENDERECNRLQASARADDGAIDQAVRVTVLMLVVMFVRVRSAWRICVAVRVFMGRTDRLGLPRSEEMSVRPRVGVAVLAASVPMRSGGGCGHQCADAYRAASTWMVAGVRASSGAAPSADETGPIGQVLRRAGVFPRRAV